MKPLPELKKITTHVLRLTSICSQFVKLDGQLGWLAAPADPCQDGYEFHKAFGVEVMPWHEGILDDLQTPTDEELAEFHRQRRHVDAELSAYYDRATYSGD